MTARTSHKRLLAQWAPAQRTAYVAAIATYDWPLPVSASINRIGRTTDASTLSITPQITLMASHPILRPRPVRPQRPAARIACCDPTAPPYDCHECGHQFDAPCCCTTPSLATTLAAIDSLIAQLSV